MNNDIIINIATDFTPFPGGRTRDDGPFSGELFRDDFLIPALQRARSSDSHVVIAIDGVAGLPPSFLEEAFGGLMRLHVVPLHVALKILNFKADTARVKSYPAQIVSYMKAAA